MSEPSLDISEELLSSFLDEAPEYLDILDEGLMAFEEKAGSGGLSLEDPEDQARMNEMFRAAHSLKGLGAAMGFDKIRDLTHLMETLFDHVRMGKRTLTPAAIDTLFGVFDKLKELVKELTEPTDEPVTIEDALATLEAILSSPETSSDAAPAQEEAAPAPEDTTPTSNDAAPAADEAPSETPIVEKPKNPAVDLESSILDNAEMAVLFVETTLETLDQLNDELLKLEQSPSDLDVINDVFRCAHNIKGATGAAGCHALYQLTHDMETVLDLVRHSKLQLDDLMMQAVFGAADKVRADVNLIKEGKAAELSDDGLGLFDKWLPDASGASDATPAEDVPQAEAQDEEPQPVQEPSTTESSEASNDDIKSVEITFPENFSEAEIQAYLIYNKLSEAGDIIQTIPDVDSMDGSSPLEKIVYQINTSVAPNELKKMVESYGIERVEVSGSDSSDESVAEAPAPADVEAAPVNKETSSVEKETPSATEESSDMKTDVKADAASPSPAPSGSTPAPKAEEAAPASKPSTSTAAAAKAKTPAKVGETIRVDLERLDQLMNLGGELVINKARLTQIHGRIDPLFRGQNIEYLVEDMVERMSQLNQGLHSLSPAEKDAKRVGELSELTLHLSNDFDNVKGMINRVRSGRSAMNDFSETLHALNRVSEGMQKRIMETRMVSVGPLFQRFRRVVRDISRSTGKKVELVLMGESTELDKRMIDELGDPLTHMIRNSVDHGIETPEERAKTDKPETAQVILNAYHRGRHICIEVKDDGKGVNIPAVKKKIVERQMATQAEVDRMTEKEIVQYIFRPGFSTAAQVTDLSGRGMGMDIVINKLESINGTVEVDSVTGEGATVTIKLPLTLAIMTAVIARIGQCVYAIPLEAVAEIITVPQSDLQYIQQRRVVRLRDRVIPVAFFEQVFDANSKELLTTTRDDSSLTLVIIEMQDEAVGLIVDELIGQEDVVIKSIAENYRNIEGITGASIMGDGTVSLILDAASMMHMFATRNQLKKTPCETHEKAEADENSASKKELVHVGDN
ncbi:MAG: chemotaxis protein CheA [Phycisphaerales bacterium]|nr:chemotaxis protein CheA [Phycisphaerales bacterium]